MRPGVPAALALIAGLTAGGAEPADALAQPAPFPVKSPVERCAQAWRLGDTKTCESAAAQHPDDVAVLRDLAGAYIETADFDRAVETQERVAMLRPDDPRAHEDLAGTLGFIRQYERAARELERALALRPPRAADYRTLAILYQLLNNPGLSAGMTRRAADLGDPIAMFDFSAHCRDGWGVAKDPDAAVAWAERAAEAGHLGAMALLTDIFLEGLYGQAVDEPRALRWAERLRMAENRH